MGHGIKSDTPRIIMVVIAAFLVYGVVAGLRSTSGVFATEISDLFKVSYGTISGIYSLRNLIFAISCPLFGFWTLRRSHVYVLIMGLILSAVSFIGPVLLPSVFSLFIFQGVFLGLGAAAVCYSIVYSVAAPLLPPKFNAMFSGILSVSQGTFNIYFAPFIGLNANGDLGLGFCFTFIGVLIACIIPVCLLFHWKNEHSQAVADAAVSDSHYTSPKSILKTMIKSPFFYLICGGFLVYGLCDGQMVNHLYERTTGLGLTPLFASLLVMLYGFALIIGPLVGGIIATKVKNRRLCIGCVFLFWAIIAVGMDFLPSFHYHWFIVLTLLLGVSISMCVPFFSQLLQEKVPLYRFAPVFAIVSSFPILGYSISSLCGGICYDITGYFFVFDMIIIALAVVSAIVFFSRSKKYREAANE